MTFQSEVKVVEYDSSWKQHFQKIRNYIEPELKNHIISIEHIGSTSVEGLAAKPIIDIDVIVDSSSNLDVVIQKLQTLGFSHRGNLGIEGREAFTRNPNFYNHNLYVCMNGVLALENHLKLRNYLRQNPHAVLEYSRLKLMLAQQTDDIEVYIEGKTDFITRILSQEGMNKSELNAIRDVNKKK